MVYKLTAEIISPGCSDFLTGFASIVGNPTGDAHKFANAIAAIIEQGVSGHSPMHIRARLDDSASTTATATAAVTFANIAAGDKLFIQDSAQGLIVFTAVSTVPVAGDNTFQVVTDATTTANSLRDAINTSPNTRGTYSATATTGTVTITAIGAPGARGNLSVLGKSMANAAGLTLSAFTGGRDAGSTQTLNATLGANPTNGQTFTIGAKTITFATSAANQDQVTIAGTAALTATALTAVLNANTDLNGFFVATNPSSTVVAVEMREGGQMGRFISVGGTATSLAWTNAQTAGAATDFRPTTVETNKTLSQGVTLGLKAAAQ